MRILVVEDERSLNALLAKTLSEEGYSVDACFSGTEALDYAAGAQYDAIIMDIMLPKLDGISAVKILRERAISTPVVFLTARTSLEDRVGSLEAGGDYYLCKPFRFEELFAVLRAVLRKYSDQKTNLLSTADLTLDTASRTVKRGGQEISLTAKEFALLSYMLRNKGVVLTREMIEEKLWNYDYKGGTNVVDVYIGYLRKKIDAGFETKLIRTVWGVGWMLKEG